MLATAEELKSDAESRGLRLSTQDGCSTGDEMSADPERLRVVMTNLIQNALRHTPKGGEEVVRALPKDAAIRFEVSDTGEGVAPEFHQRIFEKYFQVPGHPSGSAGLGLYISREVVVAHGGEMGVESEKGKGATFWFEIPRAVPAAAKQA
jgi:signal transduction histidine kinase